MKTRGITQWAGLAAAAAAAAAVLLILTGCSAGTAAKSGSAPSATQPAEEQGAGTRPPAAETTPTYYPPFREVAEAVPAEVAEAVRGHMNNHLNGYLSADLADQERIKEFALEAIRVHEQREDGPVYIVTYSVLPYGNPTDWWAGSGRQGSDGWMLEKALLFQVRQESGKYLVQSVGIG